MDFMSLVKMITGFIATPDGVVILSFSIYIFFHRRDHCSTAKLLDTKFTSLEKDFSGIKSIEDKIDKYIWRMEGDEAKKIKEFIKFVFNEERVFIKKAQVELREYIREIHDFEKDKDTYYAELSYKVFQLWQVQRKTFETKIDPTYMRKFIYVSNILTPIIREHIRSIVDIVLDKALNGTRESTYDEYLVEAFSSIKNIWEDLIETEIRKDLI